jgi:hypothetical protein
MTSMHRFQRFMVLSSLVNPGRQVGRIRKKRSPGHCLDFLKFLLGLMEVDQQERSGTQSSDPSPSLQDTSERSRNPSP